MPEKPRIPIDFSGTQVDGRGDFYFLWRTGQKPNPSLPDLSEGDEATLFMDEGPLTDIVEVDAVIEMYADHWLIARPDYRTQRGGVHW